MMRYSPLTCCLAGILFFTPADFLPVLLRPAGQHKQRAPARARPAALPVPVAPVFRSEIQLCAAHLCSLFDGAIEKRWRHARGRGTCISQSETRYLVQVFHDYPYHHRTISPLVSVHRYKTYNLWFRAHLFFTSQEPLQLVRKHHHYCCCDRPRYC